MGEVMNMNEPKKPPKKKPKHPEIEAPYVPEFEVPDPPVPNRAHTEMRLGEGIDVLTEPEKASLYFENPNL